MEQQRATSHGEGAHSLTGKSILIVGPGKLQNDLMAFFLEQQTGTKCLTAKEPVGFQGIGHEDAGRPDLILLDCGGKSLEELIAQLESHIHKVFSRVDLALFNVDPVLGVEQEAVVRGVKGFFYEKDPLDRFPKGVRAILNGELWVSREVMSKCILKQKTQDHFVPADTTDLTAREVQILAMVAVGAKNEDIADKLCISPHTVKTHIYNIFKKINVPNRLQAALWAANNL